MVFDQNDEEVNDQLIEAFNKEAARWRRRRFFDNNSSGVNKNNLKLIVRGNTYGRRLENYIPVAFESEHKVLHIPSRKVDEMTANNSKYVTFIKDVIHQFNCMSEHAP